MIFKCLYPIPDRIGISKQWKSSDIVLRMEKAVSTVFLILLRYLFSAFQTARLLHKGQALSAGRADQGSRFPGSDNILTYRAPPGIDQIQDRYRVPYPLFTISILYIQYASPLSLLLFPDRLFQTGIPLLLICIIYHLMKLVTVSYDHHALLCPGNGRVKQITVQQYPWPV